MPGALQVVEKLRELISHNIPLAMKRRLAFDLLGKRGNIYFVASRYATREGVRKVKMNCAAKADVKERRGVTCSATSPSGVKRNLE